MEVGHIASTTRNRKPGTTNSDESPTYGASAPVPAALLERPHHRRAQTATTRPPRARAAAIASQAAGSTVAVGTTMSCGARERGGHRYARAIRG